MNELEVLRKIKQISNNSGISQQLLKQYASRMEEYIKQGSKFGNNIDGFLKWNKKAKRKVINEIINYNIN